MARMLLASLLAIILAGCYGFKSESSLVCDQAQRTELLNIVLQGDVDHFPPSPPFTIAKGFVGWIQVTRDPESAEGLFGKVAGIAEVYAIPAGATPDVTTDSNGNHEFHDLSITIDKALTWRQLPLQPGSWQFYADSNPGLEVVSCPAE